MKMRKKKDELYETAEILLLATRMKELGRKSKNLKQNISTTGTTMFC